MYIGYTARRLRRSIVSGCSAPCICQGEKDRKGEIGAGSNPGMEEKSPGIRVLTSPMYLCYIVDAVLAIREDMGVVEYMHVST